MLDRQGFERLNRFLLLSVGAQLVSTTSGLEVDRVEHLAVRFRDTNGDLELTGARGQRRTRQKPVDSPGVLAKGCAHQRKTGSEQRTNAA